MSSVCPTKWSVFEKERTLTSDCQVVSVGVSPTKYDIFLLVIDLFKRSCCFFLTPHYYDSFMMWPTGYAPTMLAPPTPSFEQFLKINSIIFRKASEWRYHICNSEISRIYQVIYSLIHKTTPPPRKRVKWNKRNTQQRFQGPNLNYFSLFFGINAIIFRKAAEWRYNKCISEISRIYKVIHSSIHKTTPPSRKRVKWNKRNTQQRFQGPN